jgi:hypothetical protein
VADYVAAVAGRLQIYDHEGSRLNYGYLPQLRFEFPRQTFLAFLYAEEAELLRPRDFPVLTQNKDFLRATREITFQTNFYRQVGITADYRWGNRIHYAPAVGQEPFLAWRTSLNLTATVRPMVRLRVDNTYLLFRLRDHHTGLAVLNNHIVRSKWNYQFTKELSLRLIAQYNAFLGNPQSTYLPNDKNLNADLLATYPVRPSTAVYVGYNSNLQNVDPALRDQFINDGRHFFVKVSYLFRF